MATNQKEVKETVHPTFGDDGFLHESIETKIKEKALALSKSQNGRKIFPIVVHGDTELGEKEFYVCYLGQPTFPQFSKFIAASKKDDTIAIRALAKDVFIEGDRELVDNDSLFIFGTMAQVQAVMSMRRSYLINL